MTIAPFETAPGFVGLARHLSPDDRRLSLAALAMQYVFDGLNEGLLKCLA